MTFSTRQLAGELVTYLSSQGFGTPGTNLFHTQVPESPTVVVGVVSTGGRIDQGSAVRHPSLQVMVRDTIASTAYSKVNTIHSLLNHTIPCLPSLRGRFIPHHEPGPYYSEDDSGYPVYVLNFTFDAVYRK